MFKKLNQQFAFMKRALLLLLLISCTTPGPTVEGLKCMFQQEDQTATVYFSGNMMRLDVSDTHTIYTDDTMFNWIGGEGTKVSIELLEEMSTETGQEYQSVEEIRTAAEQESDCSSAKIEESLFIPPESIEFSDMTELIRELEQLSAQLQK